MRSRVSPIIQVSQCVRGVRCAALDTLHHLVAAGSIPSRYSATTARCGRVDGSGDVSAPTTFCTSAGVRENSAAHRSGTSFPSNT
jgi:hypothetical protein